MEIVTGDRYLDMLARFVEENVAALLDGSNVLKLNPLGLHYLQARLDSLQELERLHTAAPVDYLRAYIADLGDHRALELLRRVLRLLGSVKVVSVLQAPARDPTPITLLPFQHLRSLELRGCDLSTSAAKGLLQLRPHLEKLVCHNSTDALRHIFAERMVEIENSQVWSRLTSVSCACNGIPVMDESLQLLPAVEVLDLRRNRLTHVSNLGKCNRLNFLDLGFNWIQSVSRIDQVASSLTTLILRFNGLSTTRGIEKLYLLRLLDLSCNIISSFHELERLGGLRFLSSLNLESNPITFTRGYRETTYSLFPDPGKLCLDGKHLSRIENWKVNKLISKRCKQDGSFGLYTPAVKRSQRQEETMTDNEELMCKGRKKGSRVAVIADEADTSSHVASMDQAHDHTSFGADDGANNDTDEVEARLEQLMQRVEALKKDKSAHWLTEISKLFENDAARQERFLQGVVGPEVGQKYKQVRRRKKGHRSGRSSGSQERTESKPVDAKSSSQVLNDLIEVPLSASSSSSPPHFNKEVFERRQNLEEELLQVRSGSLNLSDNDSTTSTGECDSEHAVEFLNTLDNSTSATGTSNSLLVEGDSCFSNPMWVGSALGVRTDSEGKSEEPSEEASHAQKIPRLQTIRRSRQAWRIVPLEYEPGMPNNGSQRTDRQESPHFAMSVQ